MSGVAVECRAHPPSQLQHGSDIDLEILKLRQKTVDKALVKGLHNPV